MYVTPRNGRPDKGSAADTPRFVITNAGFESEEQVNARTNFQSTRKRTSP